MERFDPQSLEPGYSVREIARVLGKHEQFVRELVHSGALKGYRIGVELRIFPKDFQEYLEANVSQGPAASRHPGRRPVVGDAALES
jgi:excisionase family DNA binding protein